mmetsp:Transcript_5057/g.9532  ORF Transcript_5057/g.9532 Transcript_5057/m.9532 type:complete len:118 (+) Transcript_5057:159-512(+)
MQLNALVSKPITRQARKKKLVKRKDGGSSNAKVNLRLPSGMQLRNPEKPKLGEGNQNPEVATGSTSILFPSDGWRITRQYPYLSYRLEALLLVMLAQEPGYLLGKSHPRLLVWRQRC